MCELYQIDPSLKELKKKLSDTYKIYNGNEAKNRNYNFLTLETTIWNKNQRESYSIFQKESSPITPDGKKNNKHYRQKFPYRCIVDTGSFNKIIERLNYCVTNSLEKETKFFLSNIDKIFYIISHIIQYSTDKTKENKYNKDNKIALSKKFLEYFIQRESSDLLAYMIHINLIDGTLETYNAGPYNGQCRRYWLVTPPTKEYVIYSIDNKDMINKRFSEEKEIIFEEKKKKTSFDRNTKIDARGVIESSELHEYFTKNISFNVNTGYEFLSENLNVNPISFSNYVSKQRKDDNFKLHKIGRDLFGNRFYHPFCNFPKQLRKFIQINGSEDTDIIDISNSQPYFFAQLFNLSFLKYIKLNTDILTDYEYGVILSYAINPEFKNIIKSINDLVSKGLYYDYISTELNITRGEAKQQNMYLFFSDALNKISTTLKHEFKLLIEVKSKISTLNKNRFAKILQQVESHFIIDKIFFDLKDLGINTVPIHDAFIVKKSDIQVVEDYINSLSIKMGISSIPFTKLYGNSKPKNNCNVIDKHLHNFARIRELSQRKEFLDYLKDNFMHEKMNYLLHLSGNKRAKFGKHRKAEKTQMLFDQLNTYTFSEEQEEQFKRYEQSLEFVLNTAEESYNFYLKSNETFENFTMHQGILYKSIERITPIDYINHTYGADFKNRVNSNRYNYNKLVEV